MIDRNDRRRNMGSSKESDGVDAAAKSIYFFLTSELETSLEKERQFVQEKLGSSKTPEAIIERVIEHHGKDGYSRAMMIYRLTQLLGETMRDHVEDLIRSDQEGQALYGYVSLLYIDEDRALESIDRICEKHLAEPTDFSSYFRRNFRCFLERCGTPKCRSLATKIRQTLPN